MGIAFAICASVVLHLATLMLLSGSLTFAPQTMQEGMRRPPIQLEVKITLPQLDLKQNLLTDIPPPAPGHDIKSVRSDHNAVKLLTPPPFPLEKNGKKKKLDSPQPGIVGSTYIPSSELSKSPQPLNEPEIILPPGWLEAFGQAEMTLYISVQGNVDTIAMGKTNLPQELHEAVRDAFYKIGFKPGEINGQPVPSTITIEADVAVSIHRTGP